MKIFNSTKQSAKEFIEDLKTKFVLGETYEKNSRYYKLTDIYKDSKDRTVFELEDSNGHRATHSKSEMREYTLVEDRAESSFEATGGGGPVNIVNARRDFENYARQLRKKLIIGDTPIRGENPKNNLKIGKNGYLTGNIDNNETFIKAEQVDIRPNGTPNPARESCSSNIQKSPQKNLKLKKVVSLEKKEDDGHAKIADLTKYRFSGEAQDSEIQEIYRLAKEIGLETAADLKKFLEDLRSNDALKALRKYREELGPDFKIKE